MKYIFLTLLISSCQCFYIATEEFYLKDGHLYARYKYHDGRVEEVHDPVHCKECERHRGLKMR